MPKDNREEELVSALWEDLSAQEFNSDDSIENVRTLFDGVESTNRVCTYINEGGFKNKEAYAARVNYHRPITNLLATRILKDTLSIKIINAGDDPDSESNTKKLQHLQNSIWSLSLGDSLKADFVEDALVDGYAALYFEHRIKMLSYLNTSKGSVDFCIEHVKRDNLKFYYKSRLDCVVHRELVSKALIKECYVNTMKTKDKEKMMDALDALEAIQGTYDSIYVYTKYVMKSKGVYEYTTVLKSGEEAGSLDSGTCACLPFSFYDPVQDRKEGTGLSIISRNATHINNINSVYLAIEEANKTLGQVTAVVRTSSVDGVKALLKKNRDQERRVLVIPTNGDTKDVQVDTAPIYGQTTMNYLVYLQDLLFKSNGATQEAASGEKPKGLRTGAAIREATYLSQSTYLTIINKYKAAYVDFNTKMFRLIDEVMESETFKNKKINVFADGSEFASINWKKLDYANNKYSMFLEPVSKLADTPEGRLEFVAELSKIIPISGGHRARLLATPDLRVLQDSLISRERAVSVYIELFLEGKKNEISSGIDGQVQYDEARTMYNNELAKDVVDNDKVNKLHDFIKLAKVQRDIEIQEQLALGGEEV